MYEKTKREKKEKTKHERKQNVRENKTYKK